PCGEGCPSHPPKNRPCPPRSTIPVPGVLVGVIIHFSDGYCHIVPADHLYRLSLYRRVVPSDALALRSDFVDSDRAIRVNRAHINLGSRSWEFGFFEVCRPRTGKTTGWYAC